MLRFLTRTRPHIFSKLIFHVQTSHLARLGFLAKLNYYDLTKIDRRRLVKNSTGADYTERSVREEYRKMNFNDFTLSIAVRLLRVNRRGILVFTSFIEEAQYLVDHLPGEAAIVTGSTPKSDRETILRDFQAGRIKVVANVGVLTTGFDYPELDTVVLARPTMSLALYYQMVGRAIRPHKDKPEAWIVDLCGNYNRFGRVEEMQITCDKPDAWYVKSPKGQLTNVYLH